MSPMRAGAVTLFLFAATLATRPAAAPMPAGLEPGGHALVARAIDGETLELADGRRVRLAGIEAPAPPRRQEGRSWPLAEAAHQALAELAVGRQLALFFGARRGDRYDRLLAHLLDHDGKWLQGELLARGLARVRTVPDLAHGAREMLAIEGAARAARRGLWAHPAYRILSPIEAGRFLDTFQLIEGRVARVEARGGYTYLTFGAEGRGAFTLEIAAAVKRKFRSAGLDPAAWPGENLRVRGLIGWRNGPAIEATHAEQIERLGR
ncbi:MAG: thermonuclease family protein [Pseudomonadota bacterium]